MVNEQLSEPVQVPSTTGGGEEQTIKEAVKLSTNLLYDKKVFDGMIKAAQKDPVMALSSTAIMILDQVEAKLGLLKMEELFALVMILVTDAADAMQQGGVPVTATFTTDAVSTVIQMWLQNHPDRFSPEEIQAGVNSLQEMGGGPPEGANLTPTPAPAPQGGQPAPAGGGFLSQAQPQAGG